MDDQEDLTHTHTFIKSPKGSPGPKHLSPLVNDPTGSALDVPIPAEVKDFVREWDQAYPDINQSVAALLSKGLSPPTHPYTVSKTIPTDNLWIDASERDPWWPKFSVSEPPAEKKKSHVVGSTTTTSDGETT